jgi:hypothetical protein
MSASTLSLANDRACCAQKDALMTRFFRNLGPHPLASATARFGKMVQAPSFGRTEQPGCNLFRANNKILRNSGCVDVMKIAARCAYGRRLTKLDRK